MWRDVFDGMIWVLGNDDICFGVIFLQSVGTVQNRSKLLSLIVVVFAFEVEVHLVSSFDFLVALFKTLFKVALVPSFLWF